MRPTRVASVALIAVALGMPALPAFAQDAQSDARLRKLESEVRALQRQVFPGGDRRYFEPQITQSAPSASAQTPATSAVTDILKRLDSLERQIANLTGQIEGNTNRIAQLEARSALDEAARAESTPALSASPGTSGPSNTPAPSSEANLAAMTGGASTIAVSPSAQRLSAVTAIEKPQTGDAGDDEYTYGFRLWDAGFYPEAQQQLKLFVDDYPRHRRTSWGRNLLGRAYLDAGNPQEAAKWFLQNYQADKTAARASDSLLYLSAAMKQLKDTKRACIALAEFSETYAAEAAGRLRGLYNDTRNGLDCG